MGRSPAPPARWGSPSRRCRRGCARWSASWACSCSFARRAGRVSPNRGGRAPAGPPAPQWARLDRAVTLRELAAMPLVTREAGSGTRDTLTDYLAAASPALACAPPAVELGTSAAVRSAIAAGVGPGVLSRLAVRDDLVLGRLVAVELAGPPLTRVFTAVWRHDRPLSAEGERLLAGAPRSRHRCRLH